jgi:hypothetical protein
MRLMLLASASLLAAAPAAAETRDFSVAPFRSVHSAGPADLIVTTGETLSVRAEGDARALDALELQSDGERLTLDRRRGVKWPKRGRATVYVTVPALVAASASGSGNVQVDRVSGPSFAGMVDGSGNLDIRDLRVTAAVLVSAGSGNVQARGAVEVLTASASGSGNVAAETLRARAASVSATGSGNVLAWASDDADVRSTGSGNAVVSGGGRCRLRATGSGEAKCG